METGVGLAHREKSEKKFNYHVFLFVFLPLKKQVFVVECFKTL